MSSSVSYEEVGESPFKDQDPYVMDTITAQGTKLQKGVWSGVSVEEARKQYENLYNTGIFIPTHFGVKFAPYDPDGALAEEEINLYSPYELGMLLYSDFDITPQKQLGKIPLLDPDFTTVPFLCSSVDVPIIEANSDSANIGHYQLNYLTGNATEEITFNMIETRNGAMANSAKAIKEIMFKKDGTQAVPKDYLIVATVYAYDRHARSLDIFEVNYLLALKTTTLALDVENRAGSVVPLTFLKMFPNITANEPISAK